MRSSTPIGRRSTRALARIGELTGYGSVAITALPVALVPFVGSSVEDGEVIDVYGVEAGLDEGWGFADFGRTILVAAVVFA